MIHTETSHRHRHCVLSFRYSPLGGWAKGGTGRILKDPTVNAIGKVRKRKEMRFHKYDHTLTLALVPDLVRMCASSVCECVRVYARVWRERVGCERVDGYNIANIQLSLSLSLSLFLSLSRVLRRTTRARHRLRCGG